MDKLLKSLLIFCALNAAPLGYWLWNYRPAPVMTERIDDQANVRVRLAIGHLPLKRTKILVRSEPLPSEVTLSGRTIIVQESAPPTPTKEVETNSCVIFPPPEDYYVACLVDDLQLERNSLWKSFEIGVRTTGRVSEIRALSAEPETIFHLGPHFWAVWNAIIAALVWFFVWRKRAGQSD